MSAAPTGTRNLAQRLAEGKPSVTESLKTGTQLAEALRKLHDSGRAHGAVTPANVILTADGVELAPAVPSATPTPYTAPEVISGKPPDVASDLFSYGAVLYEMLAGRPAFEGEDDAAIIASVTEGQPTPSGNPAVDRLIAACLAKDPAVRPSRMQKVILELKMLNMIARLAEQPAPRQLEARLNQRLDRELHAFGKKIIAQVQQHLDASAERIERLEQDLAATRDHVRDLEERMPSQQHLDQIGLNLEAHAGRLLQLEGSLAATHGALEQLDRNAAHRDLLNQLAEGVDDHIKHSEELEAALANLQDAFEQHKRAAVSPEQVAELAERIEKQAGSQIEDVNQRIADLHKLVAGDVQDLDHTVKQQGESIESLRTAMSQTDDLVERVVEALEALQSTILERGDERGRVLYAHSES